MKKILFYTTSMTMGGTEKLSIQYMKLLVENGYAVDVIFDFNMGDNNILEEQIPKNINFQYIKSKCITNFSYTLGNIGKKIKIFKILAYFFRFIIDFYYYHTKVHKIVKNNKYDIIITFHQLLPSYLTNIKSVKNIIFLHTSVEHLLFGIRKYFKTYLGKKLDKYDYIVSISNEMEQQLNSIYPKINKNKIKTIYNPFDFKDINVQKIETTNLDLNEINLLNEKFICTIARIDEGKDFKTLINAYEYLYNNNKIIEKLYIIGDGYNKESLIDFVKLKKLEDKILFLGTKSNPYIWMKKSKIFILSSKFEGFGMVIVEAMVCETFVISSNCKTAGKEILSNGDYGELFEIGNYKELADKIEYVLNNNEYKNMKIKEASLNLNRFDKDLIFKKLELLLN